MNENQNQDVENLNSSAPEGPAADYAGSYQPDEDGDDNVEDQDEDDDGAEDDE